jgi:hypothetical protein
VALPVAHLAAADEVVSNGVEEVAGFSAGHADERTPVLNKPQVRRVQRLMRCLLLLFVAGCSSGLPIESRSDLAEIPIVDLASPTDMTVCCLLPNGVWDCRQPLDGGEVPVHPPGTICFPHD